jgi:hypothetical protein
MFAASIAASRWAGLKFSGVPEVMITSVWSTFIGIEAQEFLVGRYLYFIRRFFHQRV